MPPLFGSLQGFSADLKCGVRQMRRNPAFTAVGIRMAIGATGRAIALFVCFNGLRLVMAGAALGWLGAFAAHRAIASQLYGVGFSDPITWLAAGCGILLAAVLATLLPALRAARVDPSQALK